MAMEKETLYRDWRWHYKMAEVTLEKAVYASMDDGHAQLLTGMAQAHATLAAIGRAPNEADPDWRWREAEEG